MPNDTDPPRQQRSGSAGRGRAPRGRSNDNLSGPDAAPYYCTAMCKSKRPPTGHGPGRHACWQLDGAGQKTDISLSMWLVLRTLQKSGPKVQQPITSQQQLSELMSTNLGRKQGLLLFCHYQICPLEQLL